MALNYYGSKYTPLLLKEFGVDVEIGSAKVRGIRNIVDVEVLEGEAVSSVGTVTEVDVQTGALAGLEEGAEVKVDGVDFIARELRRVEDGALTRFRCSQE